MLKIIIGLTLFISLSQANIQPKNCKKDLTDMMQYYYLAEKELNFKQLNKAISDFERSYNSSYLSLDSCENWIHYDFNHIYNYIVASENKIQRIKEDMLKFSLIKN